MNIAWVVAGIAGVGGLVLAPIAHWRALPDSAFPLGGLGRTGWKFMWFLTLATGTAPIAGAIYWWQSSSSESRSHSVTVGSTDAAP